MAHSQNALRVQIHGDCIEGKFTERFCNLIKPSVPAKSEGFFILSTLAKQRVFKIRFDKVSRVCYNRHINSNRMIELVAYSSFKICIPFLKCIRLAQ